MRGTIASTLAMTARPDMRTTYCTVSLLSTDSKYKYRSVTTEHFLLLRSTVLDKVTFRECPLEMSVRIVLFITADITHPMRANTISS
jgi:hypothetical protein